MDMLPMAALRQEDKPSKLGVWRESLGLQGTKISSDQDPGWLRKWGMKSYPLI